MEIVSTSVEEILRQVMPPGTAVLAGETHLSREVVWASTLRVRPPAFPKLGQGEMALISSEWLELIDPPLRLVQVLEGLAQRGASAVAVMGRATDEAVEFADKSMMPLLVVPDGNNLYELEGAIARFISLQRTLLHQRGAELYRRLMEASIQGKGMPGLLRVLAQSTGKAAALLDTRWRLRHLVTPPSLELNSEAFASGLECACAGRMGIPSGAQANVEPSLFDIPGLLSGLEAVGCLIPLQAQVAGYLLLAGRPREIGPLERLALTQASSVFAAEMAKEKAVVEAESRLRGDFLRQVLEGQIEDEEEFANRATYLGYDLSSPAVVIVVQLERQSRSRAGKDQTGSETLRRALDALPPDIPAMLQDDKLVTLVSVPSGETTEILAVAGQLQERIGLVAGVASVTLAAGRRHPGVRGLQLSYQEAIRAIMLGKEMAPEEHIYFFGNLGVYPVLFPLIGTPEAESFLQETLGHLDTYDERNRSEFVQTLDVYFANQENLGKTAEALHLHRNSLAYRLRRIQEVSGTSLEDADTRFRLQLALKLRRLRTP